MKAMPFAIGTIHFVGIGGIGMSGIAEVMYNLGYRIQGSDIAESATVRRLRALGIPIARGHGAEIMGDVAVLVVSSAIGEDNVEVIAARERYPCGAPGRDVGRADAAQVVGGSGRHTRKDDHNLDYRGHARQRRTGPHRHQRRHHQRIRYQRALGG